MATKLYVINTAKVIHCLNHITGPITTPTELNVADALNLVKTGYDVWEVNPYNKKERVKVTPFNYNSITFPTSEMDMIRKRRLNREMQQIAKGEKKPDPVKKDDKKEKKFETPSVEEVVKEETKKEDQKSEKRVEAENVKAEKPKHTDFEKH